MAEEEQIRCRKPRNQKHPIQSTRSKSTISSLLSTFTPTTDDSTTTKKKYFTSTKFKGLGCTAPAQVSVPEMIRTSANWEGKKARKKKKNPCICSSLEVDGDGSNTPAPVPAMASSSSCLVVPDVWCGPRIGLSTDAASVDCVVSRRNRAKVGVEKINIRERGSYGGRRMVHPEEIPFFNSDSGIGMPLTHHRGLDHVFGSRNHRHLRHRSPDGLAEIVMLQGNLVMGGGLGHDRYRDWRLDVDSMSYEELLELGDKIGYVSTGLREDEISRCVRKAKLPVVSEDKSSSPVSQWKCTICQEEYEEDDEIGKLDCGHFHHMCCIKQWLMHKKTCPICKVTVESQK